MRNFERAGLAARFRIGSGRSSDRRCRDRRGADACRGGAGARAHGAAGIPRHRQRAFPDRRAARRAADEGLVNATTEWMFASRGRLSVTISSADRLMDVPRAELAQTIWTEVAKATGIAAGLPPWQIVRERRATFAATPGENTLSARCRDALDNLFLAGDWTDRAAGDDRRAIDPAIGPPNAAALVIGGRMTRDSGPAGARTQHRRGDGAMLDARSRTGTGVRARGRRHDSGRIRAAAPLSRRAGRCRAGAQDRRLSAPHPGRARRLAAVP